MKEQINYINEALTKENIYNNDICHTNVCINNNKIYLIDFGCTQPLNLKLKKIMMIEIICDLMKLFNNYI